MKRRSKKNYSEKKEKQEEQILYQGRYRGTSKSYGFVELAEKFNKDGEEISDIFVADINNKLGAITHDDVLIKIVPSRDIKVRTGIEGVIVDVVKRNIDWCIGVLKVRNGEYYVLSDKKSGHLEIFVNRKNLQGAELDNLVRVKLASVSLEKSSKKSAKQNKKGKTLQKKLYGEIELVLGEKDSASANYESILLSHGIKTEFDEKLIEISNDIMANANENEESFYKDREDLRDKIIFTIDGINAKDLDDAISIETDKDKNYVLGVHIADVSHYVSHKSPLDIEAYDKGTSVYFIDNVVPMLPEALSNGICSLSENKDRLCLSVFMTIDKRGETIKTRFADTVINSKLKGIYSEINDIFADIYKTKESDSDKDSAQISDVNITELNKKYKQVLPDLKRARNLAEILKKRRVKNGALELESIESEFVVTHDDITGEPKISDIKKVIMGESESLIEEFMLKANEAVAEFLSGGDFPCVYRVHEKPFYDKIEAFAGTLRRFGYNLSSLKNLTSKEKEIHPKELQKILNHYKDTPLFQMINTHMLRSLAKARYSEENVGHFGLASDKYCHFTSPIRRYPDLVNHRILKMALAYDKKRLNNKEFRQFIALAAKQSTVKEINAVYAEREIDDLYRTIYMSEHIGDVYIGIISSVTNFGVFVTLDNTCEGLVHVSDMDGYYEFDSSSLELYSNSKRYSIGQKVKIKVVGVNIPEGTVNFIFW